MYILLDIREDITGMIVELGKIPPSDINAGVQTNLYVGWSWWVLNWKVRNNDGIIYTAAATNTAQAAHRTGGFSDCNKTQSPSPYLDIIRGHQDTGILVTSADTCTSNKHTYNHHKTMF